MLNGRECREKDPQRQEKKGGASGSVFCRQTTPPPPVHEKERFCLFFALNFINFFVSNVFFRGFFGGDVQRGTSAPEKCRKHSARMNLAKGLAVPSSRQRQYLFRTFLILEYKDNFLPIFQLRRLDEHFSEALLLCRGQRFEERRCEGRHELLQERQWQGRHAQVEGLVQCLPCL